MTCELISNMTVAELLDAGILTLVQDGNHGGNYPKVDEFVTEGIPLITGANLRNGKIDYASAQFLTAERANSLRVGKAIAGDVLLSHKGTMGKTALVPFTEYELTVLNPQLTLYRIGNKRRLNNRYLKYYFDSKTFQDEIERISATSTISTLPIKEQKRLLIPIPSILTQESIVEILGPLDDLADDLTQINTTLEALAQTLFKSWFVNFDPVHAKAAGQTPEGMSPELAALFPSEFVESELGMIPKGWRVAKVAELGQVICGKTPSTANPDFYGADIPFITIPDMHGKACIYETSKNLSLVGAESQKNKFLPVGSICMSCIATPGLVVFTTRPSQTNQQINSVVPLPEFGREFSFFAVKGIATEVRLQGSSGSVFHNLNKSSFENIVLTMPTVDLISAFNKASSPILETIVCNHLQISALERIRDELLPRLISGKFRIEEAEEAVSEVLGSTAEEEKAA